MIAAAALTSGCMAFHSAPVTTRGQMQTAINCSAEHRKFKEVSVEWKQRLFRTDVQSSLSGEESKLPPSAVDAKDQLWINGMIKDKLSEAGLLDETNGTGTLQVVAISYNRWDYSVLSTGFLIDTSWLFILPSSIPTKHFMHFSMRQNGKTMEFVKSAQVTTRFHLLLFPLYPFMPPGRSESSALKSLVDSAVLTMLTESKKALECYSKKFTPPPTEIKTAEPKSAAPSAEKEQPAKNPPAQESASEKAADETTETPVPAPPSAPDAEEYGVQIMPE